MLKVLRLNEDAKVPTRNLPTDAGLDLYSLETVVLEPHTPTLIQTGVAVELPPNCVGKIETRSSMAKKGITTLGGVIDEEYRGDLGVMLINLTNQSILVERHHKIAQLLIYEVQTPMPVEVGRLTETNRGNKGFGSSGL